MKTLHHKNLAMKTTQKLGMLVLLLLLGSTHAQEQDPNGSGSNTGTCQSVYLQQPPNQLQCNPYHSAELQLECTAYTTLSNQQLEIVWFRSRLQQHNTQDPQEPQWVIERLDGSQPKYSIPHINHTTSGLLIAQSRIQVRHLDINDMGDYWCRILLNGAEWLIPSDSVTLLHPSAYSSFSPCTTTMPLSKRESKCASWDLSLPPTNSPAVSNSPTVPTATNSPSVPTATSSSPANSHETISPSQEKEDGRDTQTTEEIMVGNSADTDSSESDKAATSTVSSSSSSTDEDATEQSNEAIFVELYVAIAVVVFFSVVILILIPIVAYLCIKRQQMLKSVRARNNLEQASAERDQRRETLNSLQMASDYLVPLPFTDRCTAQHHTLHVQQQLDSTSSVSSSSQYSLPEKELKDICEENQQEQQERFQSQSLTCRTFDTASLGYSHEYEDIDVADFMEETGRQTTEYTNDRPVMMKRNAAYRSYRTMRQGDELPPRSFGHGDVMIIPNPPNCLYQNV